MVAAGSCKYGSPVHQGWAAGMMRRFACTEGADRVVVLASDQDADGMPPPHVVKHLLDIAGDDEGGYDRPDQLVCSCKRLSGGGGRGDDSEKTAEPCVNSVKKGLAQAPMLHGFEKNRKSSQPKRHKDRKLQSLVVKCAPVYNFSAVGMVVGFGRLLKLSYIPE
jgi:hypothetical protein